MRTRLAALLIAAACLGCAGTASAAVPEGFSYEQTYIKSADGTELHADVMKPADLAPGERTPVLMVVSPYAAHGFTHPGGTGALEEPPYYPWLNFAMRAKAREHRYTLMIVDVRGFGGSGGCWNNMGAREEEDVKAVVEWAATREWSTGRVALGGLSYDAATAVMALAAKPHGLVGAITMAPISGVYRDLYMNGVPHWGRDFFPLIYSVATNNQPGSIYDDPVYWQHWANHAQAQCQGAHTAEVQNADGASPYWIERERAERAATSDVPVLGSQGFLDWDAPPNQLLAFYTRLKNPHGVWLGQFAHQDMLNAGALGREGGDAHAERFLAEVLRDERPAVADPDVVVQEAPSLRWRTEKKWPPVDARAFGIALKPGSYTDVSGNASGDTIPEVRFPSPIPCDRYPATGRGTWTFTRALPHEVHLAGSPRVKVHAAGPPEARLIALLYDVAPDGQAYMITRGATLLRSGDVDLTLYPQDWRVTPGHRLGLLISAADESMWRPHGGTGAEVRVESGTLSVPALRFLRDEFVEGGRGRMWDQVKRPIQVDAATVEERESDSSPPPAPRRRGSARPSLTIRVKPTKALSRRRVRYSARVTSDGTPVQGATVKIGLSRAMTDRSGRARLVARLYRAGPRRAVATKRGFTPGRTSIRVRSTR